MSKIKVGDTFTNNQGCQAVVIGYTDFKNVLIRFLDDYGHITNVQARYLRRGGFDNPFFRSLCGVGFLGDGKHKTCTKVAKSNGRKLYVHTKSYNIWSAMIVRCYSPTALNKSRLYRDVIVCDQWHNFQNFTDWYEENQNPNQDYVIDKDLLSGNSKIYSPATSALVPSAINAIIAIDNYGYPEGLRGSSMLQNKKYVSMVSVDGQNINLGTFKTAQEAHQAYVIAKEAYVKEVANKWRGRIDERVYEALMSWKVNP